MVAGQAKIISESREATVKANGERTYRRQYLVPTTNKFDDENVVLAAPGLPQRYFPFVSQTSVDNQALAIEVVARNHPSGDKMLWIVDAIFSTEHDRISRARDPRQDPLAEPPEFDISFEAFRVAASAEIDPTTGDEFKKALKNSANEIYDPQPERDESRPILTITRNEQFFNVTTAIEFQDAVNTDVFMGAAARQAKIKGIRAKRQYRKNAGASQFFWNVTYTIAFNRATWDLRILDQGTFYLSGNDKIPFKDNEGNRIVGLLDGAGGELAANADPEFNRFRIYKEKPFAQLQLPTNINIP